MLASPPAELQSLQEAAFLMLLQSNCKAISVGVAL